MPALLPKSSRGLGLALLLLGIAVTALSYKHGSLPKPIASALIPKTAPTINGTAKEPEKHEALPSLPPPAIQQSGGTGFASQGVSLSFQEAGAGNVGFASQGVSLSFQEAVL